MKQDAHPSAWGQGQNWLWGDTSVTISDSIRRTAVTQDSQRWLTGDLQGYISQRLISRPGARMGEGRDDAWPPAQ